MDCNNIIRSVLDLPIRIEIYYDSSPDCDSYSTFLIYNHSKLIFYSVRRKLELPSAEIINFIYDEEYFKESHKRAYHYWKFNTKLVKEIQCDI